MKALALFLAVLGALLVYRHIDRELAEWKEEVNRLVGGINEQHQVFVAERPHIYDGTHNDGAVFEAGEELLRINKKLVPMLEHKPFGVSLSSRESDILRQCREYLAKRARNDAEDAAKASANRDGNPARR